MTGRQSTAGLTVVELLVFVVAASALLLTSWSWLWTVGAGSHHQAQDVDARTSLAFARRALLRDVRAADGLAAPADGAGCGAASLALTLPGQSGVPDFIQYGWNGSRGILWRKTTSSYVAEGVERFRVEYFDRSGRSLAPGADGRLSASQLNSVSRLQVELDVRVGRTVARGVWAVALRGTR